MNPSIAKVFDLSPAEKLQLMEDLWDDLSAHLESVPLHDWQKDELIRRKAAFQHDSSTAMNWKDTKRWIRKQPTFYS
ncbi:MAG: addiction module protein [Proteobacteria bacterium]|nr:addiction module protein [Pseudomonadota bacterium]